MKHVPVSAAYVEKKPVRRRNILASVLMGVFLLCMINYAYPGYGDEFHHLWEIMCVAISFLGLHIRVFTLGHKPMLPAGSNTQQQLADMLNTTGIYSIVRHPLYLGNLLIGLGIVLFVFCWWLALIYALVFRWHYRPIIVTEESCLRDKFGAEYIEWACITPAMIPTLASYRTPKLRFAWNNVLAGEQNRLLAVIIAFFTLEVTGDYIVENKVDVDVTWGLLLGIGCIVWMTCRTLKKASSQGADRS